MVHDQSEWQIMWETHWYTDHLGMVIMPPIDGDDLGMMKTAETASATLPRQVVRFIQPCLPALFYWNIYGFDQARYEIPGRKHGQAWCNWDII